MFNNNAYGSLGEASTNLYYNDQADATNCKVEPYFHGMNTNLMLMDHQVDHQVDEQQQHFNHGLDNKFKTTEIDLQSSQYNGNLCSFVVDSQNYFD